MIPAVAQRQSAELDDVLARVDLPPTTSALHARVDQALAGCLHVARADGESERAGTGVVHAAVVAFEVGDGVMNGLLEMLHWFLICIMAQGVKPTCGRP